LADAVHASGRGLILCGAREQPARLMHQAEFEEHVGAGNISPSIAVALERAKVLYHELEQKNLQGVGENTRGAG
jgi:SulP family sulfate permease